MSSSCQRLQLRTEMNSKLQFAYLQDSPLHHNLSTTKVLLCLRREMKILKGHVGNLWDSGNGEINLSPEDPFLREASLHFWKDYTSRTLFEMVTRYFLFTYWYCQRPFPACLSPQWNLQRSAWDWALNREPKLSCFCHKLPVWDLTFFSTLVLWCSLT